MLQKALWDCMRQELRDVSINVKKVHIDRQSEVFATKLSFLRKKIEQLRALILQFLQ